MGEKRRQRRGRVLKEGRIVLNGISTSMACIIRDRSEGGAKLRVPAPTALPSLLCVTEGLVYPAEVIWRRGDDMGVAFVGDASMTTLRITLQAAQITVHLWRLLATKAALRAVRRVCDRIAPAG